MSIPRPAPLMLTRLASAVIVLAGLTCCGGGAECSGGSVAARVGGPTGSAVPTSDTSFPGARHVLPASEVAAIVELGATEAGPPPVQHQHGHHGAGSGSPAVLDDADAEAIEAELEAARAGDRRL